MIRNFGHLWERKYLNYGRPKVKGHLKGYLSPRSPEVDFREQIGIYVLFDKDLNPVLSDKRTGIRGSLEG